MKKVYEELINYKEDDVILNEGFMCAFSLLDELDHYLQMKHSGLNEFADEARRRLIDSAKGHSIDEIKEILDKYSGAVIRKFYMNDIKASYYNKIITILSGKE